MQGNRSAKQNQCSKRYFSKGAQEVRLRAIEAEVAGSIDQHSGLRDAAGHRRVVRNGRAILGTQATGLSATVRRDSGPLPKKSFRQPAGRVDGFIRPPTFPTKCPAAFSPFPFYDLPAEHWIHIRTTNPIESTFATVRLRTKRTKGCGSRTATLTMVFKRQAEKHWRRINGHALILKLIEGVRVKDGIIDSAAKKGSDGSASQISIHNI
jgi:hypothetical protein